ncbi:glycosyl hydrolase family 18 protein [Promicromonospora sp. NPDC090134]|uniref:glycosyl hydrolase family 18 protein n=1 Tax=Promicromonospora sp. NPDC090134 TaxID=3364408 RepID=UPI00382FC358
MSRSLVRLGAALTAGLLALIAAAGPAAVALGPEPAQGPAQEPASAAADHRVIAFYQTIYETGSDGVRRYVDPKPLLGSVTDVNVGAIHLNADASLTVNDIPADHAELGVMWDDLATMQDQGVTVSAFLGGAAPGTYRYLREDFDRFYPVLRDFLRAYDLDGVDLDIEETFSLADTIHLVDTLRADFGPDFVVTLTPVATDMAGRSSFSGGFSYAELERQAGDRIDWYNTQFYCGWGDLRTTTVYDQILANGFTPGRVVAGTVTNPGNCSGYVDPHTFDATVGTLVDRHPDFGGVFGWEYFNSVGYDGGGRESWFSHVADVVGGR